MGKERKCIIGKVFGWMFILSDEALWKAASGRISRMCDCLCLRCGKKTVAAYANITSGKIISCGCWNEAKKVKHGHARDTGVSRAYSSWRAMRQRCLNPKHTAWKSYGGAGIKVCLAWRDRHSFTTFLQDNGQCPEGLTIDRFPDQNGNYTCGKCPECLANGWQFNTRWATRREQAQNTHSNRNFTVNGITGCLNELARHFAIHPMAVAARLKKGWPVEKAFTQPSAAKR